MQKKMKTEKMREEKPKQEWSNEPSTHIAVEEAIAKSKERNLKWGELKGGRNE